MICDTYSIQYSVDVKRKHFTNYVPRKRKAFLKLLTGYLSFTVHALLYLAKIRQVGSPS